MAHYVISFTVYTLAMSGLIFFALFIYKKVMSGNIISNKTKQLSIEEVMNINPRKSLMIIKAGDERFLIASDMDKTSMLAKLENPSNNNDTNNVVNHIADVQMSPANVDGVVDLEKVKNNIDSKNMDVLFPKDLTKEHKEINEKKNAKNNANKNKTVHLEVIKNKNPEAVRLGRRTQRNRRKNVTIEVGEVKNHGLSTIKELVQKVNEI